MNRRGWFLFLLPILLASVWMIPDTSGMSQKYLTPDLIGRQSNLVIEKLKKLEFRIGDIRFSYYPGLDPGIIIKQFPPQGYPIQKKYPITLEISK